jgi:16S rRNA (cytosine967-C5)-methyltransferase
VREGRVRIQDEGSQLAALALSRARPIAAGERWLDLCAGPGGKSALLAAEARTHGAGALGTATDGTVLKDGPVLVANEVVPARAQLVRNALEVFPDPPQVLVGDGRALGQRLAGQFDRVLLDAPCTGLGALRRRPEARWRKQPADVPELTALQLALLESAALALAPGGILAYVTCSPHPAETRVVVEHAIRRLGLTALDTPAVLESLATGPLELGDGLQAQLWPHRHGTDAMFVALLGKP